MAKNNKTNKTVFVYRPDNEPIPRKGARVLDGIRLNPGRNMVDIQEAAKIRSHPSFSWLKRYNAVEELTKQPVQVEESTQEVVLTTLKVGEAIALINTTYDLSVLERWHTQEAGKGNARKNVLNELARQINDVKKGNLESYPTLQLEESENV